MPQPDLQTTIRRCTAVLVIPLSILIGVEAASAGVVVLANHSMKFAQSGWKLLAALAILYLVGSFAREYQLY